MPPFLVNIGRTVLGIANVVRFVSMPFLMANRTGMALDLSTLSYYSQTESPLYPFNVNAAVRVKRMSIPMPLMVANGTTPTTTTATTITATAITTELPEIFHNKLEEATNRLANGSLVTSATPITLKPDNDKYSYRGINLANGMKILLGSEPTAESSYAALCVLAGSLDDPWPLQGIAHFTEHMLFMGSKKFPGENDFSSFLLSHGGRSNAYTSGRSTCYFLTVLSEQLNKSLAMFADMFANPLLKDEAADREIHALDNEHLRNLKNDERAFMQVEKATANRSHPFTKFATGTRALLLSGAQRRNATLGAEVRRFFDRFYYGENMNAVVFGRESLDELQALTSRLFSAIRRRPPSDAPARAHTKRDAVESVGEVDGAVRKIHAINATDGLVENALHGVAITGAELAADLAEKASAGHNNTGSSHNEQPWGDDDYGGDIWGNPLGGSLQNIVRVVPRLTQRTLLFTFPVADMERFYRSAPDMYISEGLFSTKGPGSLFHYLDSNDLATDINANLSPYIRGFNFFHINVVLTETGVDRVDDVVEAVFAYLAYHRGIGVQRYIFNELSHMRKLYFRFREQLGTSSVADLADTLHMIESWEDALTADYVVDQFRPDLTRKLLNELTPDNCRLMIMAPRFANESLLHKNILKVEPHYNKTYWEVPFSADQRCRWSAASSSAKDEDSVAHRPCKILDYNFSLPLPNPFIPSEPEIYPAQPEFTKLPVLLKKTNKDRAYLWILQNDQLKIPKGTVYVNLLSDAVRHTKQSSLMLAIISKMFSELYAAELELVHKAGTHAGLINGYGGLLLTVSGFNQKQPQILRDMLDRLWRLKIDETLFGRVKRDLEESIENAAGASSPQVTGRIRTRLLYPGFNMSWSEELEFVQACSPGDVQALLDSIRSRFIAVVYVHGNVQEQVAVEMFDAVRRLVPETSLTLDDIKQPIELSLKAGHVYHYTTVVPEQTTNTVEVYFEIGPSTNDRRELVATDILEQIFHAETFHVLRTREQLGYRVSSGVLEHEGSTGLYISVEGNTNTSYVEERIWHFILNHVNDFLQKFDEKSYENLKRSMIQEKMKTPTTFDFGTRYWPEVYTTCYLNQSLDETHHMIELKRADIVKLYQNTILNKQNAKVLVTHIVPSAIPGTAEGKIKDSDFTGHESMYDSIPAFQSRLSLQNKPTNYCKTIQPLKSSCD